MQLLVFRALWGMTGPLHEQVERVAAAGYDGFELWPSQWTISRQEMIKLAADHGQKLIVGALIAQKDEIEPTLSALAAFDPVRINLHSGRDNMSAQEAAAFFEEALRVEAQIGVPVGHETHRGRILFTPWTTAAFLRQFERLRITADYSHWVNVCERLPDDEADALALANRRAVHIHGRVGYEEGPQVPDPAAPEYAAQLAWHERQWQAIRSAHEQAGPPVLTFTPEYGPPNYLHTLPHTHVPVADLWRVCLWGAERARAVLR
ncbi:MAG: sugar phosphate isomerase/epimerase [Anaerolineae bacterium]|nr:sugar phosphate isomerase/epimerase [Anaerolineae bacterium]